MDEWTGGVPSYDSFPIPRVLGEFSRNKEIVQIVRAALEAVEPRNIVKRGVSVNQGILRVGTVSCDMRAMDRLSVLAVGKAVGPMVEALVELLGSRVDDGIAIVKEGERDPSLATGPIEVLEASHPVPGAASLVAAEKLVRRAKSLKTSDLAIVVIGGGASSLLTYPASGIDLLCLQQTTEVLLRSGATIHELNTIRKHISAIKGGRLAKHLAPARTLGLLLSDVVGDDLDVIGSGPISPDSTFFVDAWNIVQKYDLMSQIPRGVIDHLEQGCEGRISETPKPGDPAFNKVDSVILGSNRHGGLGALAAAEKQGFRARLVTSTMEGEARDMGFRVAEWVESIRMENNPVAPPACLILGGETTVRVRGRGKGGRNQELALAAAIGLEGKSDVAVVTLATDGGDGPTDAAGAVVSGKTVARARALGLDPAEYLEDNNSYVFFDALGDLLKTGPTLTNVADLLFVFVF